MPRAPHPLPSELGEQFLYADGRAAGASRKRLRAHDLEAPFRGVRRAVAPSPVMDDGPLARDRMLRARVLRDARAYAEVMAPHAFFAGRTAVMLYGLPVRHTYELEVAVFAPARAPRRIGIRGRKVARGFATVRVLEGLPLASPVSCWAMLGTELSERDLIRLGDAIVRVPRGADGRPRLDLQLATPEELHAAALERGRPGRTRLMRALPYIRVGSMSPLETDTRLESIAAGFPEPELDVEIRASVGGRLLGVADLRFPAHRVLVEVEGDHHRTDRAQWARDIEKVAAYAAEGYETVRVTGVQVRTHPRRAVSLIRAALIRGGWSPEVAVVAPSGRR
jgi:hypothetical protein